MPRICISYRRADSTAIAGRIYDRLVSRYGAETVFMDVSDIPYGVDFREQIQKVFRDTKVLVAVIGPEWLGAKGKRASARIQESDDPIRVEINTALRQRIDVIPVLIDHVKMPPAESLPPDIQEFAFRNAMRLDTGVDFQTHIERLMAHIDVLMPNLRRVTPTGSGAESGVTPAPASLSRLLPYAVTTIVLLLLAHYLIIMKLDTDPIYLRIAAIIIATVCGFLLLQREHAGVGLAAVLGLCISVVAALGMTAIVGLIDGHSLLPSDISEWQEAFEYIATITLATAVGNVLARAVLAAWPRRSGTP